MTDKKKDQHNYLYHGTGHEILPFIAKHGLDPEASGGLTWFHKDINESRRYAESPANQMLGPKRKGALLRVPLSKIPADAAQHLSYSDITGTSQVIPPNHIEHEQPDGSWEPLESPPQKAEGGAVDLSQYQDSNNFGLYSHAAETAAALPQAKGTPDQFKAMLKDRGVKPVEIENSNYDDTFAGRPSVTKDELVQHFRQSMPKIQEHVLGAKPEYPQHLRDREQAIINSYQPRIAELQARAEDYSLPSADRSEARDDVQDLYDQMHSHIDREIPERGKYLDVTPTKFHNYTMPGGENYRELLLQLKRGDNKLEQKAAEAYQRKSDLVAQYDQIPPGDPRGPQIAAQIQEAQREYSRIVDESMKYEPRPFNAGHWDQADVLAHLRMKDRTGPNGEKILHVDEIQSDWGQQGRSKGFSDPKAEDRYNAHVERMRDRLREETRKTFEEATKGQSLTPEDKERILRPILNDVTFMHPTRVATALGMQDDHQRAIDELRDSSSGVPHGPYVTNTAAWTDLALKRALHEAASGGYDKIVFTKGQDQADRYDLSNQIEHIEANPLDNGRIHLVATSKEDGDVVHEGHHDIDKIDDVIGKELADKVRSQIKFPEQKKGFLIKNKRSGNTADMLNTLEAAQNVLERFPESLKPDLEIVPREYTTQGRSAVLRGVDLKIGGEGMKSFYDKIVPTQLMNIVKKMDPSAKMETALLNTTGEEWPYSIQIAHDGDKYWLKGRHPDKPGDVQLSDKFDGYEQADDLRRMMYAGFHKPVHALTITPKMRDSILRGQKAFAAGGEVDDDGITAYHGSPYDFERFDSSKIGTNEGTAFGHGLYFAGSEPVAQTYRGDPEERYRRFSGHMTPKEEYAFDLASRSGDVRDFDVMTGLAQKYGESIDFDEAAQLARNAISKRGHMYEVGINAQPHHFLDWDKPIQEQPYVMEQLIKAGVLTPDGETSFMYNAYLQTFNK